MITQNYDDYDSSMITSVLDDNVLIHHIFDHIGPFHLFSRRARGPSETVQNKKDYLSILLTCKQWDYILSTSLKFQFIRFMFIFKQELRFDMKLLLVSSSSSSDANDDDDSETQQFLPQWIIGCGDSLESSNTTTIPQMYHYLTNGESAPFVQEFLGTRLQEYGNFIGTTHVEWMATQMYQFTSNIVQKMNKIKNNASDSDAVRVLMEEAESRLNEFVMFFTEFLKYFYWDPSDVVKIFEGLSPQNRKKKKKSWYSRCLRYFTNMIAVGTDEDEDDEDEDHEEDDDQDQGSNKPWDKKSKKQEEEDRMYDDEQNEDMNDDESIVEHLIYRSISKLLNLSRELGRLHDFCLTPIDNLPKDEDYFSYARRRRGGNTVSSTSTPTALSTTASTLSRFTPVTPENDDENDSNDIARTEEVQDQEAEDEDDGFLTGGDQDEDSDGEDEEDEDSEEEELDELEEKEYQQYQQGRSVVFNLFAEHFHKLLSNPENNALLRSARRQYQTTNTRDGHPTRITNGPPKILHSMSNLCERYNYKSYCKQWNFSLYPANFKQIFLMILTQSMMPFNLQSILPDHMISDRDCLKYLLTHKLGLFAELNPSDKLDLELIYISLEHEPDAVLGQLQKMNQLDLINSNVKLMLRAAENGCSSIFAYADRSLIRTNKHFIYRVVLSNEGAMSQAPDYFRSDEQITLELLKYSRNGGIYFDESLWRNESFVNKAILVNPACIAHIDAPLITERMIQIVRRSRDSVAKRVLDRRLGEYRRYTQHINANSANAVDDNGNNNSNSNDDW